ncbi:unnamed protein product [Clonostachys byssicola]|uniref:Uncharacterized protein n=1 Tax=Clonostachys byssicola TaxID=160290 RepID=A0A9N9Y5K7_9HYPO|nr:unnamed protein product [Clonostachys byssicola]
MFWALCFAVTALPLASALPMASSDNILTAILPRYDDISDDDITNNGGQFSHFPKTAIIGIVVPIVAISLLLVFFRTALFGGLPRTMNNGYVKTSDDGSTIYRGEKFAPSPSIKPQMATVNPTAWPNLPRSPPPAYTPTSSPRLNNSAASEWPRPAPR